MILLQSFSEAKFVFSSQISQLNVNNKHVSEKPTIIHLQDQQKYFKVCQCRILENEYWKGGTHALLQECKLL